MPRIVADLVAARPVDLAIIDGVESVAGGEGPWIKGLRLGAAGRFDRGHQPGLHGRGGGAGDGYDPRATRGTAPFGHCDNTLLLAEARGVGTADLKRIEIRR